jgi:hypothetical protein
MTLYFTGLLPDCRENASIEKTKTDDGPEGKKLKQ